MGSLVTLRPPLQVIVVRHPTFDAGKALAQAVVHRFVRPGEQVQDTGLGIPAFVRSKAHPGHAPLPRPISDAATDATLVVVLVCEGLVLDAAWLAWLDDLAAKPHVHLHAFKFDDTLRFDSLHFLRGRQAVTITATADDEEQWQAATAYELARRVEAQALSLLTQRASPPSLFVSYHGDSGSEIAETLWHVVTSEYRDLSPYVAHLSVRPNQEWAAHIRDGLLDASAVLSVVTEAYTSRPWCREEIHTARTPRLAADLDNCWHVTPIVAIDARAQDWARFMPELGGHRVLRWDPQRSREVIDRAVSDGLLATFHARWAEQYARADMTAAVISWIPDVRTLLRLEPHLAARGATSLLCPGLHVDAEERELIARALPSIALCSFGGTVS
ncbi:MAG: toll/interleukin-1 receptor domain-containing protein [Planctomycetota bacterium]